MGWIHVFREYKWEQTVSLETEKPVAAFVRFCMTAVYTICKHGSF